MVKEELEVLRTVFESGDIFQVVFRFRELLVFSESIRLEVGVTGESGVGKSFFINVFRGLGVEDFGAVFTGVVEIIMYFSFYSYSQFFDVTLWDLSGVGFSGCSVDKYLKQVDFGRYDFFLLVFSRRCGVVEIRLVFEILRQGKKFYFVRIKVDEDLAVIRIQRFSGFSEVVVLQEIREYCVERLRVVGVIDFRIFFVFNFLFVRYDFFLFVFIWEYDLFAYRRYVGLLSLFDILLEVLQKKKDMFQEQVFKTVLVSGVIQVLFVFGLAVVYDDVLFIRSLRGYYRSFGLDDDSLVKLVEQVGKQVGDLRSVIRSSLVSEFFFEIVLRFYLRSFDGVMRVVRVFEKGIFVFGTLVVGGISFGIVYIMFQGCFNEMVEDVQRVRIKVLEEDESQSEVSLEAAGDNGVEKRAFGEGVSEEVSFSVRRKFGFFFKYIFESWKKRDLSEEK